jgi:hypothetical protein
MTVRNAAARALGHGLRLVPRRCRWPILVAASGVAARVISGKGFEFGIDGYREIALWRLMLAASRAGLRFDPVLEHRGPPPEPPAGGRGLLMVGAHALLNYLAVRYVHDHGVDPVLLSADPSIPLPGTPRTPRGVPVSATLLPAAVRHLRAGDVVCAMIDRPEAGKDSFRVDTAIGPLHLAEPLLKFAAAAKAEILFCSFRVIGGKVVAYWSPAPRAASLEEIKSAFAAFLRTRIEEGHGRRGPRARALRRPRTGGPRPPIPV